MQTKTKSFKNAIFCAIITLVLCLTAFAFAGCNPPKDPPAEPPTTTTSLTKAQCNTAFLHLLMDMLIIRHSVGRLV